MLWVKYLLLLSMGELEIESNWIWIPCPLTTIIKLLLKWSFNLLYINMMEWVYPKRLYFDMI